MKRFLIAAGTGVLALASGVASADVAAEATAFTTQWGTDAAAVGGALIGAAFLAIGFKWVKGMIFS